MAGAALPVIKYEDASLERAMHPLPARRPRHAHHRQARFRRDIGAAAPDAEHVYDPS